MKLDKNHPNKVHVEHRAFVQKLKAKFAKQQLRKERMDKGKQLTQKSVSKAQEIVGKHTQKALNSSKQFLQQKRQQINKARSTQISVKSKAPVRSR